jgi:hypothetical protein
MTTDGGPLQLDENFLFSSLLTPAHIEEIETEAPEIAQAIIEGSYAAPETSDYEAVTQLQADLQSTIAKLELRVKKMYRPFALVKAFFGESEKTHTAKELEAKALAEEIDEKTGRLKEYLMAQLSSASYEVAYGAKLEAASDYLVEKLMNGKFDPELAETLMNIESTIETIRDRVLLRHNVGIPSARVLIKLNQGLRENLVPLYF